MMSNIISFSDKFIIFTSPIQSILFKGWAILSIRSSLENLEITNNYIIVNGTIS